MIVAIRTDASSTIGTGHVMRCIALAEELRARNVRVIFVCRDFPGSVADKVERKRFEVQYLPYESDTKNDLNGDYTSWLGVTWDIDAQQTLQALGSSFPIDWLVVDHYSIDNRWESELRNRVRSILVIDDLANRNHDCDVLLDQNKNTDSLELYRDLVPKNCRMLLGPKFSLVRREFALERHHRTERNNYGKRILIFWGGVDSSNETAKTLHALKALNLPDISLDVVVGKSNPFRDEIEMACRSVKGASFHYDVENMAELVSKADLAIGASGVSCWERCCLGVPTIMAAIAPNQVAVGQTIHEFGAGLYLGQLPKVSMEMFQEALVDLLKNRQRVDRMSRAGMNLVDGLGGTRVVTEMLG